MYGLNISRFRQELSQSSRLTFPCSLMSTHAGPSRLRPTPDRSTVSQHQADILALAAGLTLEDIEELESTQKGKHRQGEPMTDAELALSIFAEDTRSSIIFDNDRAIALSLQASEQRGTGLFPQVNASEGENRHRSIRNGGTHPAPLARRYFLNH